MNPLHIQTADAAALIIDLSDGLEPHYLGGGEDIWAISAGNVGLGTLTSAQLSNARSKATSPENAEDMAVATALETVAELLTEFFGPGAYVMEGRSTDPESGVTERVLTAHYCFPPDGSFEDLERLHRAFRMRYVSSVAPEHRKFVVLASVATEDGN